MAWQAPSDQPELWICRFAWTTQTRCPHTHNSDRKKRRKRLEDFFEEEEKRDGRRLYTLISTALVPSMGSTSSHELRSYVKMLRIADLRDAQADRMRVRR